MILKTMDKATFRLTEAERTAVLDAIQRGDKYIAIQNAFILTSSISGIYPEEVLADGLRGVLHDGTLVVKRFGLWTDARNPDARLDLSYYPEAARDEVLTEAEWKAGKLDELQGSERMNAYAFMLGKRGTSTPLLVEKPQ